MSQGVSRPWIVAVVACLALTACGRGPLSSGASNNTTEATTQTQPGSPRRTEDTFLTGEKAEPQGTSLFKKQKNPANTVAVNKYIWNAAIEVLNFLPIESADPFSGLIVTGYGTPPGGRTAYRATILIDDPAMDARSLSISLMTRSGPVDDKTRAAVEDSILTRARQLRMQDLKL